MSEISYSVVGCILRFPAVVVAVVSNVDVSGVRLISLVESQLSNSTIPIVPRLTKYNIIQTSQIIFFHFILSTSQPLLAAWQ